MMKNTTIKQSLVKFIGNHRIRNVIFFLYSYIASIIYRSIFSKRITTSYCATKRLHWLGYKFNYLKKPLVCHTQTIHSQTQFVCEIVASFNDAIRDGGFDTSDHWKKNIDDNASVFVRDLTDGNIDAVERYLNQMFLKSGLRGISMSDEFFTTSRDSFINHTIAHNVVAVSEYSELVRTECLEIGGVKHYDDSDVLSLIVELSKKLGHKLSFPEFFGAYGLRFGNFFVTPDMFEHIYAILKAHDTYLSLNHKKPNSVIEIGGGFGGACYWASKIFNTKKYTIVDLPLTSVYQAWFLGNTLGRDSVHLYRSSSHFDGDSRINLCPPSAINDIANDFVDLAINQNSFPEMSDEIVSAYIASLSRIVRPHGVLYHNNQEAQVLVPSAIKDNQRFLRLYRSPSWTRDGYVEEAYSRRD